LPFSIVFKTLNNNIKVAVTMAKQSSIFKSINLLDIKRVLHFELSMMSSIKLKGIDSSPNELTIRFKGGKCVIKAEGSSTLIKTKVRWFKIFIWDLFLDVSRAKQVHNAVLHFIGT
jgi:hypothetical protein